MKKILIGALIVAVGISIIALIPATTKKSPVGWKILFVDENGKSFEYHTGMIQSFPGIKKVWIKSEEKELFLLEIRDDFMFRVLEGGDEIGKLKNIKPDTPEAKLVRLLF